MIGKLYFRLGRRQNQPAVLGQATPAQQSVGIQTVSPGNARNRRADFQRLGDDPRLHRIRPATPTSRHRQRYNVTENLS